MSGNRMNGLVERIDDLQSADNILVTLKDAKGNIDLRLVVADLGLDFGLGKSGVLVKIGQGGDAGAHQIVAELPSQYKEAGFLDRNLRLQFLIGKEVVAFEMNFLNAVLATFVNVIDDLYGLRPRIEMGIDFRVEIALGLEIGDEVAAAFVHQLRVH